MSLVNELWPTWQKGLQDAQFLFTRMTLDQAPDASVPGMPGVSTQREVYETQHADTPGHAEPSGYEQWLASRAAPEPQPQQ